MISTQDIIESIIENLDIFLANGRIPCQNPD